VVIYNEYYVAGKTVPEHAKALKPMVDEVIAGKLRFMVIDPAAKNRTDIVNGKSAQGLYQEYGLYFTAGNNSVETGILRVNSYIERGKLKIYNTCTAVAKEGLNYKFPEISMDSDKNLDEKPIKKDDHIMDALRYALMRLPDNPDLLKLVAFEPKISYNIPIEENEYGWDDQYRKDYTETGYLGY
jgi:hypothetical protein